MSNKGHLVQFTHFKDKEMALRDQLKEETNWFLVLDLQQLPQWPLVSQQALLLHLIYPRHFA